MTDGSGFIMSPGPAFNLPGFGRSNQTLKAPRSHARGFPFGGHLHTDTNGD